LKRNGGKSSKARLREAGGKVLSSEIAKRPKTGFTLPIGDWMRGAMREPCGAAIEHVASLPIIDGAEVHRTWQAFLADKRSMHWSRPLALVVLGSYLGR